MTNMNSSLNNFPKSLNLKFAVIYSKESKTVAKFFKDLYNRVAFDCKLLLSHE